MSDITSKLAKTIFIGGPKNGETGIIHPGDRISIPILDYFDRPPCPYGSITRSGFTVHTYRLDTILHPDGHYVQVYVYEDRP